MLMCWIHLFYLFYAQYEYETFAHGTTTIILTETSKYFMSGLLKAACDGDLDKMQRLIKEGASVHEVARIGRNALMPAVLHNRTPVVYWLITSGGARIFDRDVHGNTVLAYAAVRHRYSLMQWLIEVGGAPITEVIIVRGESKFLWDILSVPVCDVEFVSLLKVIVLLSDAPPDFIAKLSLENTQIMTLGRQIRVLRPSYLEQHKVLKSTGPLPSVLQSIVATYAEPTPKDMRTDWVQWM
jgi:hypothetical protein